MATIVQIPTPRSRTARSADHPDGATILFFTGVRYVRDEEPADAEPVLGPELGDAGVECEGAALSLM